MPNGHIDDPCLSALDDAAGYLSQVAGSVCILAALNDSGIAIRPEERHRRKAMRQELRRILAALDAARDERIQYRAAYHAACAKRG